jgi:hypothetical protein
MLRLFHWRPKVKLWKVAISLAAVGALAAPFVLGTWKGRPEKWVWVPLTEERRQEIESLLKAKNYCKDMDKLNQFICEYSYLDPLKEGREKVDQPDPFKYLVINLVVALVMFVGIFGLAMVIPPIALRYWRWLRT